MLSKEEERVDGKMVSWKTDQWVAHDPGNYPPVIGPYSGVESGLIQGGVIFHSGPNLCNRIRAESGGSHYILSRGLIIPPFRVPSAPDGAVQPGEARVTCETLFETRR
jgi:hypothetical protein